MLCCGTQMHNKGPLWSPWVTLDSLLKEQEVRDVEVTLTLSTPAHTPQGGRLLFSHGNLFDF